MGNDPMPNKSDIKTNDPSHIFIIAEAGSNWKVGSPEEDKNQAKQLIKIAASSGADAIKFQVFRPNSVYVPNAGKSEYLSEKGDNESIYDILEKFSMPYEMVDELAQECNNEKIIFMSTAFSVEDAKIVNKFVPIHKIASYEINHVRLLEYLASTNKPIILSTGASTYDEIDFAVNLLKKNGANSISLLQCTAKYPTPIEALNLAAIPEIQKRYDLPVGLSDHSLDPVIAPIISIGLGATIIEKHFTLSKDLKGPDHSFALNPEELNQMIKAIRMAEKAKGLGIKEILPEEIELKKFAIRSLQAICNIKKGEILLEGRNFDVLRPGNRKRGTEARYLSEVNGKKATKDIEMGDGIIDYE